MHLYSKKIPANFVGVQQKCIIVYVDGMNGRWEEGYLHFSMTLYRCQALDDVAKRWRKINSVTQVARFDCPFDAIATENGSAFTSPLEQNHETEGGREKGICIAQALEYDENSSANIKIFCCVNIHSCKKWTNSWNALHAACGWSYITQQNSNRRPLVKLTRGEKLSPTSCDPTFLFSSIQTDREGMKKKKKKDRTFVRFVSVSEWKPAAEDHLIHTYLPGSCKTSSAAATATSGHTNTFVKFPLLPHCFLL